MESFCAETVIKGFVLLVVFLNWYHYYFSQKLILVLLLGVLSHHAIAASLFSRSDGTWSFTDGGPDCSCTPAGTDDIVVNHAISITGPFTLTGSITVNSGGDLTITDDFTVDDFGTLTVSAGGTLSANNDMSLLGDSNSIIAGNLDITGSLTLDENAMLTVQSGGFIDIGSEFNIESKTNNVLIAVGSTVHVTDDFSNSSTMLVINGNLDIDGNFDNQQDAAITGSGTITYGGTCDSKGTVNGETDEAAICDGSGVIILGALPVELLFFNVAVQYDKVLLSWATASEEGFDFFSIERSTDAREFYSIGTVYGSGYSDERTDYIFYDPNPVVGRAFYRLRAQDFDGSVEYFEIVSVIFDNRFVKVFPNPSQNGQPLQVILSLGENEKAEMTLNTVSGVEIYRNKLTKGTYEIPLNGVAMGVYILRITYPGEVISSKLIIQ